MQEPTRGCESVSIEQNRQHGCIRLTLEGELKSRARSRETACLEALATASRDVLVKNVTEIDADVTLSSNAWSRQRRGSGQSEFIRICIKKHPGERPG